MHSSRLVYVINKISEQNDTALFPYYSLSPPPPYLFLSLVFTFFDVILPKKVTRIVTILRFQYWIFIKDETIISFELFEKIFKQLAWK